MFTDWRPYLENQIGNMEANAYRVALSENFAMRLLAWALLYHYLGHGFFALKQVRAQQVGAADHLVHAIAELQAIVNAGCLTSMEQLRVSPLMKYMQPGTASMLHLEAHTRDKYPQPRVSSKEFNHLAANARAAAVAREVQRRNAELDIVAERKMVPAPMPINALDDVAIAQRQQQGSAPLAQPHHAPVQQDWPP